MRFLFGFTLGVLLTLVGSFAWVTNYGGTDYILTLSPRFQEVQSSIASLEQRVSDLSEKAASSVALGGSAT
ncbi:MAG: hypothetical protein ACREQQ_10590 [Candidatus Binatia bacterium]